MSAWLPSLLFEIRRDLGEAIALALAAEHGGRRISIPKRASPDHPLAARFGAPLLAWLVARYPGEAVLVPLGPASSHRRIVAETQRLLQAGVDTATVARTVGCHERTVYRHRAAQRDGPGGDPRQGDLFDDC